MTRLPIPQPRYDDSPLTRQDEKCQLYDSLQLLCDQAERNGNGVRMGVLQSLLGRLICDGTASRARAHALDTLVKLATEPYNGAPELFKGDTTAAERAATIDIYAAFLRASLFLER